MVARQDEDAKDDDDDNKIDNSKDDKSNEGEIEIQISEQDDDDYEESSSEEPGGLVGLITNLSGVNCYIFQFNITLDVTNIHKQISFRVMMALILTQLLVNYLNFF